MYMYTQFMYRRESCFQGTPSTPPPPCSSRESRKQHNIRFVITCVDRACERGCFVMQLLQSFLSEHSPVFASPCKCQGGNKIESSVSISSLHPLRCHELIFPPGAVSLVQPNLVLKNVLSRCGAFGGSVAGRWPSWARHGCLRIVLLLYPVASLSLWAAIWIII